MKLLTPFVLLEIILVDSWVLKLPTMRAHLGAEVIYITGPTHYKTDHSRIKTIPVVSAEEMYTQVHTYFKSVDVAILSAAVADYKPKIKPLLK